MNLAEISEASSAEAKLAHVLFESTLKMLRLTEAKVFILIDTEEKRYYGGKDYLCDLFRRGRLRPAGLDVEMEADLNESSLSPKCLSSRFNRKCDESSASTSRGRNRRKRSNTSEIEETSNSSLSSKQSRKDKRNLRTRTSPGKRIKIEPDVEEEIEEEIGEEIEEKVGERIGEEMEENIGKEFESPGQKIKMEKAPSLEILCEEVDGTGGDEEAEGDVDGEVGGSVDDDVDAGVEEEIDGDIEEGAVEDVEEGAVEDVDEVDDDASDDSSTANKNDKRNEKRRDLSCVMRRINDLVDSDSPDVNKGDVLGPEDDVVPWLMERLSSDWREKLEEVRTLTNLETALFDKNSIEKRFLLKIFYGLGKHFALRFNEQIDRRDRDTVFKQCWDLFPNLSVVKNMKLCNNSGTFNSLYSLLKDCFCRPYRMEKTRRMHAQLLGRFKSSTSKWGKMAHVRTYFRYSDEQGPQ